MKDFKDWILTLLVMLIIMGCILGWGIGQVRDDVEELRLMVKDIYSTNTKINSANTVRVISQLWLQNDWLLDVYVDFRDTLREIKENTTPMTLDDLDEIIEEEFTEGFTEFLELNEKGGE